MILKKNCKWILPSWGHRSSDSESRYRFLNYSAFVFLGVPTMLVFNLYHLNNADYLLAFIILLSGTTLTLGWRWLCRNTHVKLVYRANVLFYVLLMSYLMLNGGSEPSKLFWLYTFPLIVHFLLGKDEGLYWNCGLVLIAMAFLFIEIEQIAFSQYTSEFKARFFLSYLIVSALSYWFEYLRSKYSLGMEKKAKQLKTEKHLLQKNIEQRIRVEQEKDLLIKKLQTALEEIDTLRKLLPICCYCKKIKDHEGLWNQLEAYFEQHADVSFTHGICPDCADEHYPNLKSS